MNKKRRNPSWTYQELEIAIEAYIRIIQTSGSISAKNPEVIRASKKLNELKIHENALINLDFRNPEGVRRRISYIHKIASGQKVSAHERYKKAWDNYQHKILSVDLTSEDNAEKDGEEPPTDDHSNLLKDLLEIDLSPDLTETEKKVLTSARKGQGSFRNELIRIWKYCPITLCENKNLLRASHIKPWAKSTNFERLDKFNGILLSPTFDALFDKGYISFDDNGKILISEQLSAQDATALGIRRDTNINTNKEQQSYLDYHRKTVFKR
ncbi:HNH endonuclease [Pseudomonas aeruginosa]|uniref:HNH endonuclease n=1 Tax=Pseudomonas aeruginosa TaxID=287 RepID=UPI0024C0DDC0|nr:HNH endonuclease signature motif containing protein [Pseudomonas aeruginosa]WHV79577.1 HNH endonuclease [Pseudomonas aeruginosa]